jgi:hypothetical protein
VELLNCYWKLCNAIGYIVMFLFLNDNELSLRQLQVTMQCHEACYDCSSDDENCVIGHSPRSYHYHTHLGSALTADGNHLYMSGYRI